MQHDRMRELMARIARNHQRAIGLIEDARSAVMAAGEALGAAGWGAGRYPPGALADLREVAQHTRAVVEERQELLVQLDALSRPAS
ncbi:MAG TPA: hypothetical protein VGR37_17045 [Longimicrobiaceae bacterium]|nr:hypothetical protein [Longimicrobiaceae bacterium]